MLVRAPFDRLAVGTVRFVVGVKVWCTNVFRALTDSMHISTKCRWLVILAPHKKPEVGYTSICTRDTTNMTRRSRTDGDG